MWPTRPCIAAEGRGAAGGSLRPSTLVLPEPSPAHVAPPRLLCLARVAAPLCRCRGDSGLLMAVQALAGLRSLGLLGPETPWCPVPWAAMVPPAPAGGHAGPGPCPPPSEQQLHEGAADARSLARERREVAEKLAQGLARGCAQMGLPRLAGMREAVLAGMAWNLSRFGYRDPGFYEAVAQEVSARARMLVCERARSFALSALHLRHLSAEREKLTLVFLDRRWHTMCGSAF